MESDRSFPLCFFLVRCIYCPHRCSHCTRSISASESSIQTVNASDTEAAFNDATAIVIFTIILASVGLQQISVLGSFLSFGYTLGVGVLIGLGVAFVGEILSSLLEDRVAETILTIVVVYGSYAFASGVGASGLIAVTVAGLYFGNYTIRTAMEPATREAVTIFWQIAAFLGNSVAFLLIGFQANIITTFPQSIFLMALLSVQLRQQGQLLFTQYLLSSEK